MSLVAKVNLLAQAVAAEIDAARADAIDVSEASALSLTSRGGGLWTNGTGLLGDATNFSLFEWDPAEAPPGTSGAFRADGPGGVTRFCDEAIPVNPELVYRVQVRHKANAASIAAGRTSYIGFACFDADGNSVTATTVMRLSEKAALTRDWTPDTDEYLYVDRDPSGLNLDTTLSYRKGFMVFNYTSAGGLRYQDYTRHRTVSWSTAPSITDMGGGEWRIGPLLQGATTSVFGGVFDLSAVVPAGTEVAQSNSGGTYLYSVKGGGTVNAEWTTYEGLIGGANTDGNSRSNNFFPGTAFVKPLFLVNYNATVSGESQWFAGCDMRPADDIELRPLAGAHGGVYYAQVDKHAPHQLGIAWNVAGTANLVDTYQDEWVTRWHLTPSADTVITLPATPSDGAPGRFTMQIKNNGVGYTMTLAGSNWVLQPGVNLSAGPQPVFDLVWDQVASKWRIGEIGGAWSAPALIQQDSADPGRTIYVQMDGDAAPAAPVRGDIRVREL